MSAAAQVHVRPRSDADLDECERIVRAVHALDGYPPYMPNDDFRGLLASPDAIGAYVAADGHGGRGAILGHAALHGRSSDAVIQLATAALGVPADGLGVVARLFVAPTARRRGVARLLVDFTAREARRQGLTPILDVATSLPAAVALYDDAGWTRLGLIEVTFRDGSMHEEYVFAAPEAP